MILSDSVILKELAEGNIILSDFNREHLNPNSYDMTLAPTCKILHPGAMGGNMIHKCIPNERLYEYAEWDARITSSEDWWLDVKKPDDVFEFTIPDSGFILQPGHVYLYHCNEQLGCKKNIASDVKAKSSLGRKGLEIVIGPAGFVDTGFVGSLVLEMRTNYPLRIYPNMKICQVKFERVEGEILESYDKKAGSKYMNQIGAQESLMHKNF